MACKRCRYLTMPREQKLHVIQDHFPPPEYWNRISRPWHSVFINDRITPQELIREIQSIPRFQLGQNGWSDKGRFLYTWEFSFDVGVYPVQGPGCTTKQVEIVCCCVQCPGCGIHAPTNIVTIYPWDRYYAQYGRYWRVPAKRKTVKENRIISNTSKCSTRLLFSQFYIVVLSLHCIFANVSLCLISWYAFYYCNKIVQTTEEWRQENYNVVKLCTMCTIQGKFCIQQTILCFKNNSTLLTIIIITIWSLTREKLILDNCTAVAKN